MAMTSNDGSGRPAEQHVWGGLTMWREAVSEMDNNAYLLRCSRTGELLLVDAADDAERLLRLVEGAGGDLRTVVTTHQHWDHHRALAEVVAATGASTACGADDADGMPVPPDRLLAQGDVVQVGEVSLEVVHLRGHTPGSVALAYRDPDGPTQLFTGDSLFPGGVGNTKNPGQSFESLIEDVTTRVFEVYDDDTVVWPGHGANTTLGVERPHLPEWRARGW
ncbi:MBL fold metallo-hydrolase [Pedococcus sp. NPDC057267]|uniref:MBL fold metallo-hydrolase n=1 Tax=Pedococcus sp. NPDC057267 TaxID=3346077 RepID=UPI00363F7409